MAELFRCQTIEPASRVVRQKGNQRQIIISDFEANATAIIVWLNNTSFNIYNFTQNSHKIVSLNSGRMSLVLIICDSHFTVMLTMSSLHEHGGLVFQIVWHL